MNKRERMSMLGADPLPRAAQQAVWEVFNAAEMNEGIKVMLERQREFRSPTAALLSGIAMVPKARSHFEAAIDKMWAANRPNQRGKVYEEVVIGGGLHAAIYCAIRVAQGYEPPLVLERKSRAGGVFAISKSPSFFLNSRNRPGELSVPGLTGALNVLPGAILQPADLDGSEYQSNDVLAFVIRATLAAYARVALGVEAIAIDNYAGKKRVTLFGSESFLLAERVIIATGFSQPRALSKSSSGSGRVLFFEDLMARMDEHFPLRGMKRVAVVGAGDSGKTAIEALTGQGPRSGWSVASLDWPREIDWFGLPADQTSPAGFEACNRRRYRGIARLLPTGSSPARVFPRGRASSDSEGFNCIYVNERPYDLVVNCKGYRPGVEISFTYDDDADMFYVGGRPVGRAIGNVFTIGPAAAIPVEEQEKSLLSRVYSVPENQSGIFRYAARTAALAAFLPGKKFKPTERAPKRKSPKPKAKAKVSLKDSKKTLYRASLYWDE